MTAERPVVAMLLSNSSNGKPISWSDTAYPPRMPTFHISHLAATFLILRPSCHFENVLANDDQGFCRQHKRPEAVEGAARPVRGLP